MLEVSSGVANFLKEARRQGISVVEIHYGKPPVFGDPNPSIMKRIPVDYVIQTLQVPPGTEALAIPWDEDLPQYDPEQPVYAVIEADGRVHTYGAATSDELKCHRGLATAAGLRWEEAFPGQLSEAEIEASYEVARAQDPTFR